MTTSEAASTATQRLVALGQSVWLDFISRDLVRSGRLAQMVASGEITGMTSNPTIFEKAIAASHDYDASFRELSADRSTSPYEAFTAIATEDIRGACAALRPVYDRSRGVDGYVSLELPPGIERDTAASVAEAKRLFDLVGEPNLMIKVPGTAEGLPAVTELIASGVNVNITLLFAVSVYERVAEAYIAGLERRQAAGAPLDHIASVASFFVSRVDTAVDKLLPDPSPLRGKVAVANARFAYERFLAIFSGPRWERLASAGAHVQRPLWASTGTKNPAYSDILYVQDLIAPDTVNTMPEPTLRAVLDHLDVRPTIVPGIDDARRTLDGVRAAGVDLDAVTDKLLDEGLASFAGDFERLLARAGAALALARVGQPPSLPQAAGLAEQAGETLTRADKDQVMARVWKRDHTVWKPDPAEISDRLGWLDLPSRMLPRTGEIQAFAREVIAAGFSNAVLLGMGGSSLAPEVFEAIAGNAEGSLRLHVLDTTDPDQIAATEAAIDLARTLFIVSSKSGGTIETISQFSYFWEKLPDGARYVVVTDPGSALEKLGNERAVRRIFLNPSDIGGRYSALSYFGLLPAALCGVDIEAQLTNAADMEAACGPALGAAQNPGAWLGAVIGCAARAGRDKLTLVLPSALRPFGYWVEQLVAESTGKEGVGILPVEGEPLGAPEVYASDRLFVAAGDVPALAALETAGHPVVRLPEITPQNLAAEFYRWEMATAVAGWVLGIQPFDQPNVQEAKDATNRALAGEPMPAATASVADVLAQVQRGDYIAITAYVPRNPENERRLEAVRLRLRDRYRVATTVGFGPRFLHSTGQLHKGGPNSGVFLQVVTENARDLAIPGKPFTFGTLEAAQAQGDLASLIQHGRRAARTSLDALEAETA